MNFINEKLGQLSEKLESLDSGKLKDLSPESLAREIEQMLEDSERKEKDNE